MLSELNAVGQLLAVLVSRLEMPQLAHMNRSMLDEKDESLQSLPA
jgi:hypothetical protein